MACQGTGEIGQSFVPSQPFLVAVDLTLRATFEGGLPAGKTSTIRIRAGSANGPVLAQTSAFSPGPIAPGAFFDVHYDFPVIVALVPGQPYVIELELDPDISVAGRDDNPYANGSLVEWCGADPATITHRDINFITYSAAVTPAITLSPLSATNPTSQPHTVTATLTSGTTPIAGARVLFAVSPTPAPGPSSGSATTNPSGQGTFTFTSATVGAFTITACHDANNNGTCDPGEQTATATKTFVDVTPPTCVVVIAANQIRVTANDPESGLTEIAVTARTNVTLSGAPATFSPPAFGPQVVVATRINRTLPMRLALLVTNAAGLSTPCDPILCTLAIGKRNVVSRSYSGIPYLENKLTIRALRGGPLRAVVQVNGLTFRFTVKGQKRISLASAMTHLRANKVKITLYGKAGARALVALTD